MEWLRICLAIAGFFNKQRIRRELDSKFSRILTCGCGKYSARHDARDGARMPQIANSAAWERPKSIASGEVFRCSTAGSRMCDLPCVCWASGPGLLLLLC